MCVCVCGGGIALGLSKGSQIAYAKYIAIDCDMGEGFLGRIVGASLNRGLFLE